MDPIQIIEADHRQIERSFGRFDRAVRSGDAQEQGRVARDIIRALSVHAAIEEQAVYPALARAGVTAERLDALEDHHAVKVALAEIAAMTPADERFAPKVRVVAKNVMRHVQEEEATLLPQLREELDDAELQGLAEELETLRRSAPTRPHPAAPDTPPANLITNATASVLDRVRDAMIEGAELLRWTAKRVVERGLQAGRGAAERVRRNGEALLEGARVRGLHLVEEARERGAEVAGNAAERGVALVNRVEARTALASRELRRGARAVGVRARRTQHKQVAAPARGKAKSRAAGRRRRRA